MDTDLDSRLRRLERQNRFFVVGGAILVAGAIFGLLHYDVGAQVQSIRVSEIVVVDKSGVERVRIGGNLPDPVVNGRAAPRGGQLAGIVLYDAAGVERSGYGTFSPEANVVLTLDGKQGQRTLFVATPEGDSALKMWRGNDWIEFRVDEGGARLNAVRGRELAARIPDPSKAEVAGLCSEYRALRSQIGASQLMSACRERMSDADCGACLK
jgi:hypothetical protein